MKTLPQGRCLLALACLLLGLALLPTKHSLAQTSGNRSGTSFPGPDIRLRDAAGNLIQDYQNLSFGSDLLTRSARTITITIENPGDSPLMVTPNWKNNLDGRLSLLSTPQAPIPPGSSATITIQFLTNSPGTFTDGLLQLLSNATPLVGIPENPPRPANPYLKFSATARSEFPAVTQQPSSKLVSTGLPFSLDVQAQGLGPLQFAWTKDSIPLAVTIQPRVRRHDRRRRRRLPGHRQQLPRC